MSHQHNALIVGAGGAGRNFLRSMKEAGLETPFFLINTNTLDDAGENASALILPKASSPEASRKDAESHKTEIVSVLEGKKLVFVLAGLGGNVGSGSAPYVAHLAHERGAVVIGLVTFPFAHEGLLRKLKAVRAVEEIKTYADAVFVADNGRLLGLVEKNAKLSEMLGITTTVFLEIIKATLELDVPTVKAIISSKGVNREFASERPEDRLCQALASTLFMAELPDREQLEEELRKIREASSEEEAQDNRPWHKVKPATANSTKNMSLRQAIEKTEADIASPIPATVTVEPAQEDSKQKKEEPKKGFWARLFG